MSDACCSHLDWSGEDMTKTHHSQCPTNQKLESVPGSPIPKEEIRRFLKDIDLLIEHYGLGQTATAPIGGTFTVGGKTFPYDVTEEEYRKAFENEEDVKVDTGPLEITVTLEDVANDFLERIQAPENIRYLRIGSLEIKMRILSQTVSERAVECQMEILEVISPPEARAAWLKETQANDPTLN